MFLREGALQVVTALKSDEVHVIWLRVDERVDSRVGTVDSPHAYSEPQDLSGPHWALVAGFRALESAFFKGVVDLVDRCEPGRS